MAFALEQLARVVSPLPLNTETSADDEGLSALVSVRPRPFGRAEASAGCLSRCFQDGSAGSNSSRH